jgi:ABC-type sugar transport system substrate-binding protein
MRTIEYKSKLSKNTIHISKEIQAELKAVDEKNIRVMIFLDDIDDNDDLTFQQAAMEQFLKGYADSDSIYDIN